MENKKLDVHWESYGFDGKKLSNVKFKRTPTPSGWIVIIHENGSLTSVFVPDPDHKWDKN